MRSRNRETWRYGAWKKERDISTERRERVVGEGQERLTNRETWREGSGKKETYPREGGRGWGLHERYGEGGLHEREEQRGG